MKPKLQLVRVHIWARDGPTYTDERGIEYAKEGWHGETDGFALWRIEAKAPDLAGETMTAAQPFNRTGTFSKPANGYWPMWKWDGNVEAPTLEPSWLYNGRDPPMKDWPRIHLYLRGGKVDLLSDSEVELAP